MQLELHAYERLWSLAKEYAFANEFAFGACSGSCPPQRQRMLTPGRVTANPDCLTDAPPPLATRAEHVTTSGELESLLSKSRLLGMRDCDVLQRVPPKCFGFVIDCITDLPLLLDRSGLISKVRRRA